MFPMPLHPFRPGLPGLLNIFACTVAVCLWLAPGVVATAATQPPPLTPKQGAALLKADIMGVFAHPDDETGMAATLANYAMGRGTVVANVYCTRGEGGGNMVGTHLGPALGILREAELRDCLGRLGVRYCYFLDQADFFYTESSAATFAKWGKEETLRRLVRLVRALQPEVIVTMNPASTPGQHGHHQAAAILAVEAFSAAPDPKRFPEQLTDEGLGTWQARKLYLSGDQGGTIATIQTTNMLAGGKSSADIAAEALSQHRSQAFGGFVNSPWLRRPQSFSLVKSVVPFLEKETDLLRGLPVSGAARLMSPPLKPVTTSGPGLRIVQRPAVERYLAWVKEQGLEHAAASFSPDLPVIAGVSNDVRLEVSNPGNAPLSGRLELRAPAEWLVDVSNNAMRLEAGGRQIVTVRITPPLGAKQDVEMTAVMKRAEGEITAVTRLHPVPRLVVPRVRTSPLIEFTSDGWKKVARHSISHTSLAQGSARDETDSSASFSLIHDGKTLYLDVEVKDDVLVSNIAPNDIKGHWRSDSVEICIDPKGGSEDTLGCYKIGIFPFDTEGKVRASRDADAKQGPVEITAPGTRIASKRTPDGYTIRAAIPFTEIGIAPRKARSPGFNIIIYDGDKRDAAIGENINKSRIAWSPRSGVQGRPEDWGRIALE
ncbi:MAG: hypothetical protein EXS31_18415 [Pedosphaera sp.]|nr:hypothetical protein [Pedosphaera sp.]